MSEPVTETQVRLLLERQGAELFDRLYVEPLRRLDFTTLVFDFGPSGNVAFKTSLSIPDLHATMTALLGWFGGGSAPPSPTGISPGLMRLLATEAKRFLPAGIGYALVIGDASGSAYAANAERDNVCKMIRNELLPKWAQLAEGKP